MFIKKKVLKPFHQKIGIKHQGILIKGIETIFIPYLRGQKRPVESEIEIAPKVATTV